MRKNQFIVVLLGAVGMAFALGGCQSQPPDVAPEPGGHAIGYRDTPPPSKAPPTNMPSDIPFGQDGQQMYVQPSNPMPAAAVPADASPATQPAVVRPNDVSR